MNPTELQKVETVLRRSKLDLGGHSEKDVALLLIKVMTGLHLVGRLSIDKPKDISARIEELRVEEKLFSTNYREKDGARSLIGFALTDDRIGYALGGNYNHPNELDRVINVPNFLQQNKSFFDYLDIIEYVIRVFSITCRIIRGIMGVIGYIGTSFK